MSQSSFENLRLCQVREDSVIVVSWMPRPIRGGVFHFSPVLAVDPANITLMDSAMGDWIDMARDNFLSVWEDTKYTHAFMEFSC
ncbi:MAG: hypothetical protein UX64_C0028G0001 [Microgenomates group bacterium GW2011_GWC2_46_7]|nr:MAG: hypothetical protein UX64_C0028G0001 [Microgenomates group bacterium GW2011_GWC2_46_7]